MNLFEYIKRVWNTYKRDRYIKKIFSILNDKSSYEAVALMEALNECFPLALYHQSKYPEQVLLIPPLILGKDCELGKKPFYIMTFADNSWEEKSSIGLRRMAQDVMDHHYATKNRIPSWLNPNINRVIPLNAQIEMLEGIFTLQKEYLTSPSPSQLEENRKLSEILRPLLPSIKTKPLTKHIWFECPHCKGVSISPPESPPSMLCPYCQKDVVLLLEDGSQVPDTYPLLLEKE